MTNETGELLMLHNCIYSKSMIERAITVYSGIADINCVSGEDYYICEFKNCRYDIQRTKREFENYLIQILGKGIRNDFM